MSLIATATAAFVAALQAAPAVCPVVERVRLRPQAANVPAWLVVRPDGAMAQGRLMQGGPIVWMCQIAVECCTKTSTATAPDAAIDAMATAAYARLMADPTLGGAVQHVEPVSLAYDFDVDGEQTASATFVFQVRQTAHNPAVF